MHALQWLASFSRHQAPLNRLPACPTRLPQATEGKKGKKKKKRGGKAADEEEEEEAEEQRSSAAASVAGQASAAAAGKPGGSGSGKGGGGKGGGAAGGSGDSAAVKAAAQQLIDSLESLAPEVRQVLWWWFAAQVWCWCMRGAARSANASACQGLLPALHAARLALGPGPHHQ